MSSISYLNDNFKLNSSLTSASDSASCEPLIFEAELDDALVISKILSQVDDPDDNSILIVDQGGFRLVATGDRTSQVSVFFSKSTFNKFVFNSPKQVKFRFVLKEFFETLHLLQDDAKDEDSHPVKVSLKISYRKRGDPLKLRVENNSNYTVSCDLREFSLPSIHTLMSFASFEEITDTIFYSKELYKFISGLDFASEFIFLKLVPGIEPTIKFKTISQKLGEVELEIRDPDEPCIIKRGVNAPSNLIFSFKYRTHFIKPALEALRTSNLMKMNCGSSGLLLLEHFHGQEPHIQSVEYFILSESE